MYNYRIDCWVPPKSGFDLAKKEKFIAMVESTLDSMEVERSEEISEIRQSFERFKEEGEGYILEAIVIESDVPINSPDECEEKIMPLIRKKNPDAKLVGCTRISTVSKEV